MHIACLRYFWATRTTKEFSHHQITIFHYANTRSGQVIGRIVGQEYSGIIACDGYGDYSNNLYPEAKFSTYLVHIRHEFTNIIKALSTEQVMHSVAQQAVNLLRPIFHTENQLKYHHCQEKLAQRKLKILPLMDKFYAYISQVPRPMGKLRAAIQNALN
ncbi:transposase [Limosilactobacillus sp. Lr3000]|uniref:Transposase n=1 Tax=Limosilactobacillus albertensis TaxID=2759752 RepID=A0A839H1K5_9LACO|nr:transposase [Limosilactobacillus albertensis]